MIYISHRGNINGPDPETENDPVQIQFAIDLGFDVEVDVWRVDDTYMSGHDRPVYVIPLPLLLNPKVWCHAKDIKTFYRLIAAGAHTFFHNTDDVVLTTKGYLWTYPGKHLTPRSISVLPELSGESTEYAIGICSDYIQQYMGDE